MNYDPKRLTKWLERYAPRNIIPADGQYHRVEATLLPDTNGDIEIDGQRYKAGEYRVLDI